MKMFFELKQYLRNIKDVLRNYKDFLLCWDELNNEKLRHKINIYERIGFFPKIKTKKEEIIVSLTTYGCRFSEVHYTLFSLFHQNTLPDKIILWLSEDEFTDEIVNKSILKKYKKHGLTIKYCKNYGSYKKIIPTLNLFPNSTIIICDDDAFYNKGWLQKILEEHKNYPKDCLCHVGTKIEISNKKVLPYEKWLNVKEVSAGFDIIPIGVGGTLVRKEFFYKDMCDTDLFMKIAPNTDDLWIWIQAVLKNTKIRTINNVVMYPKDFGLDRNYPKLYINNSKNGNNISMKNILKCYPQINDLLNLVIDENV